MKKKIFWFLVFLVWVPDGRAQAPYYEGKTVRIVVGYPAGSAHDQWGRLIAPYLTKFIPGNPNAIVQNMAGAGSMVAANYIYGVAKPDGLSLGIVKRGTLFRPAVGPQRGPVRLAKVCLDWQLDADQRDALHVGQYSLQNNSRRAHGRRAA
jgi:tripartite-type tricarboxylate transporter receptor subunit TctC